MNVFSVSDWTVFFTGKATDVVDTNLNYSLGLGFTW